MGTLLLPPRRMKHEDVNGHVEVGVGAEGYLGGAQRDDVSFEETITEQLKRDYGLVASK